MGDSENSNNDDNDKDDHNESGSIFGKQCSASFKANKTGTLGSLLGIETAYNELQLLLPFSDDLTAVAELLEPSFQYLQCTKSLFLSITIANLLLIFYRFKKTTQKHVLNNFS